MQIIMLTIALAAALLLAVPAGAEPQSRTFTNERGQEVGRAVTQGNRTTFTNEKGQQTGSSVRQQDGSKLFYDSKGQYIGRKDK
jgi:hypothetical protein